MTVPRHLGLILDGNRRWARAQGLPTLEGHRRGYDNLFDIMDAAIEKGIPYLSAYAFSTENWKRDQREVGYLMDLILLIVTRDLSKLHDRNARLLWLGSREHLKPNVLRALKHAEEDTKDNTGIVLGLCINHGGQREIAEAIRRLVSDGVSADEIDEQKIAEYVDHPELPPLDLIIRTSGEQRLSNFMLWRAAYSELMFTDTHWPAFAPAELGSLLEVYAQRQRRFGS